MMIIILLILCLCLYMYVRGRWDAIGIQFKFILNIIWGIIYEA